MPDNPIRLADRVKEISYTMGTGNIALAGAVVGFTSFGDRLFSGESLFYAITDGTSYEVGSGVFIDSPYDQLVRFPLKSSNSDTHVDFPEGIKEVYITYPATHSVYMGSGISDLNTPQTGQITFWSAPNMVEGDSNLVWDKSGFLGVNKSNPAYGVDLGGFGAQSLVKASGAVIGRSGVYFQPDSPYVGGTQHYHYEPNQLDQYALSNALIGQLTGTSAVFDLSGVVNQYILFKKQNAGLVFAGPPSGCTPPCSPGYPSFRQLTYLDIPAIGEVSGILNNKFLTLVGTSNSTTLAVSGILNNKIDAVSGIFGNFASTLDGDRGDIIVTSSGLVWTLDNNSVTSAKIVDSGVTSAKLSYSNSFIAEGRLTVSSGQALHDDVSSTSTLYYHPYNGNAISLYNTGTGRWDTINFNTTTMSVSGLAANTNYDVFGYNNAGTLALESAAWATASGRSVNLAVQDGVYCKSGALSRRYLGTIRTTSSIGTIADWASQRFVWNAQNRIVKRIHQTSSAGPWTYSTNTWRGLNNAISSTEIVAGLNSTIDLNAGVLFAAPQTGATLFYFLGIAKGASTTSLGGTRHQSYNDAVQVQLDARYSETTFGYQYYYPVEYVNATGVSATLYGGDTGSYFGGIRGVWEC